MTTSNVPSTSPRPVVFNFASLSDLAAFAADEAGIEVYCSQAEAARENCCGNGYTPRYCPEHGMSDAEIEAADRAEFWQWYVMVCENRLRDWRRSLIGVIG